MPRVHRCVFCGRELPEQRRRHINPWLPWMTWECWPRCPLSEEWHGEFTRRVDGRQAAIEEMPVMERMSRLRAWLAERRGGE